MKSHSSCLTLRDVLVPCWTEVVDSVHITPRETCRQRGDVNVCVGEGISDSLSFAEGGCMKITQL